MEEQKAYVGKIIYSADGRMRKEGFKCGFCGFEMPFDVVELYCTMCGRVIDWTDYIDELRKAAADNPYLKRNEVGE